MTVRVLLPQALLSLFPGCPSAPIVDATTVADAIDALNLRWPGLRDRLCDETPAIRRHINIFVAGERCIAGHAVGVGCRNGRYDCD